MRYRLNHRLFPNFVLLLVLPTLCHSLDSSFISVSIGNVNATNDNATDSSSSSNPVMEFRRLGDTVDIPCDFRVDERALSDAADGMLLEEIVQATIVEWDLKRAASFDDDDDEGDVATSTTTTIKLAQHMIGIYDWTLWDASSNKWIVQRFVIGLECAFCTYLRL